MRASREPRPRGWLRSRPRLDGARRRRDRRIAPRGGARARAKKGAGATGIAAGTGGDRGTREGGSPRWRSTGGEIPCGGRRRRMMGTAAGWTNPGGGRRRRPPPRGLGRPQRCDRRRGRVRRHRRGAPRRSRRSERLCRPRRRRNGRRLAEETPHLWQPELLAQGKFILMRFEKIQVFRYSSLITSRTAPARGGSIVAMAKNSPGW